MYRVARFHRSYLLSGLFDIGNPCLAVGIFKRKVYTIFALKKGFYNIFEERCIQYLHLSKIECPIPTNKTLVNAEIRN